MSINQNCQPCTNAQVVPTSIPPVCQTVACEEYIQSDCVVSSITASCVKEAFDDPTAQVGLQVVQNETTLTDIINQLTSVACPFNYSVLGTMLTIIRDNTTLTNLVCQIVDNCNTTCDGTVPYAVFDPITTTSFVMTFPVMGGWSYTILVTDSYSEDQFTYTYTPNIAEGATTPYSFDTTSQSWNLTPGHRFEVTVTAAKDNQICPSINWTIDTLQDPTCACYTTPVINGVGGIDTGVNNQITLEFYSTVIGSAAHQLVEAYAVSYTQTVGASAGATTSVSVIVDIPTNTTAAPDLVTTLVLNNVEIGTYDITITSICSVSPYCIGNSITLTGIQVNGPATCAPPDITSVTVIP